MPGNTEYTHAWAQGIIMKIPYLWSLCCFKCHYLIMHQFVPWAVIDQMSDKSGDFMSVWDYPKGAQVCRFEELSLNKLVKQWDGSQLRQEWANLVLVAGAPQRRCYALQIYRVLMIEWRMNALWSAGIMAARTNGLAIRMEHGMA